MSTSYLTLGSSPYEEDCAQVGSDNYRARALKECKRYLKQIEKVKPPPEGASLSVRSFPHDFGSYYEVVVNYEEGSEVALGYAFDLEDSCPARWE